MLEDYEEYTFGCDLGYWSDSVELAGAICHLSRVIKELIDRVYDLEQRTQPGGADQ